MGEHVISHLSDNDIEGAQRVFISFIDNYQSTLNQVSHYLEQVIEAAGPEFADAYRPWHQALEDLFRGAYLTAKKIPLPNPDAFRDALRLFSFESAIQFLTDLAASCKLTLAHDWGKCFREQIDLLLFSFAVLNRENTQALAR